MDVKCEKCGTEYEFDDAKVTEAGITVKCTHCGHLFRVVRQPTPAQESRREAPSLPPRAHHWMIRNRQGQIREFKDLATLQEWIVQGKVSRADEISKTGENWKPLGTIVELSSFFLAAPKETPLPRVESRPGGLMAPPPPVGIDDLLDSGEFRLEGPSELPRVASGRWPAQDDLDRAATVRVLSSTGTGPGVGPTMTGSLPSMPSGPGLTMNPDTGGFLPPQSSHVGLAGQPTPFVDLKPAPRAGSRGFLLGVLACIAAGGVAYIVMDKLGEREEARAPKAATEAGDAPLLVQLERADVAYHQDTEEGFTRAELAYQAVLDGLGEGRPKLAARAHLGLARVSLARAEYQALEGSDPTKAREKAEVALASVRALEPENAELALLYADFYRINGALEPANRYLKEAEVGGARPAEVALIGAAMGLHGGNPELVARQLAQLSAEAKKLPRARYLAAVALSRAGKKDEAIQGLVELLAANREHGPGSRLLEKLGPALAEPKPATDAGAPSIEEKPAPTPEPPKVASKPIAKPVASRPQEDLGGDFDALMAKGYQAQEQGRTGEARRLFNEAVKKRPASPEPWANLGWCDLDEKRVQAAIGNFRQSLDRSPRYADAMFGLASALEKSGDSAAAVTAYKAYLDAHPRGRKASIVERKLETLR